MTAWLVAGGGVLFGALVAAIQTVRLVKAQADDVWRKRRIVDLESELVLRRAAYDDSRARLESVISQKTRRMQTLKGDLEHALEVAGHSAARVIVRDLFNGLFASTGEASAAETGKLVPFTPNPSGTGGRGRR